MAVQFLCPSCEHPIEIDDEWASHSVACPFCRNTVTAPAESTYVPPVVTPVARSIEGGYTVSGGREHLGVAAGNPAAGFALGLSLLHLLAFFGTSMVFSDRVADALGETPTPAAVQQYMQEQLQQGATPGWMSTIMLLMIVSLGLWLGGLVCAIFAVRRRVRRGLTLAAFGLLGVSPLFVCMGFVQMFG